MATSTMQAAMMVAVVVRTAIRTSRRLWCCGWSGRSSDGLGHTPNYFPFRWRSTLFNRLAGGRYTQALAFVL
jgi:hypothetical protein